MDIRRIGKKGQTNVGSAFHGRLFRVEERSDGLLLRWFFEAPAQESDEQSEEISGDPWNPGTTAFTHRAMQDKEVKALSPEQRKLFKELISLKPDGMRETIWLDDGEVYFLIVAYRTDLPLRRTRTPKQPTDETTRPGVVQAAT